MLTTPLIYWAYGSNMDTNRLTERTKGCKPLGRAKLVGYRLCFHKRSKDGSGKADAWATGRPDDMVIGVLFEIPASGKRGLDRAEGTDYEQATVRLLRDDGATVEAFTYLAKPSAIDSQIMPTPGYRDKVLAGAIEHGLPAAYIDRFIRAVVAA